MLESGWLWGLEPTQKEALADAGKETRVHSEALPLRSGGRTGAWDLLGPPQGAARTCRVLEHLPPAASELSGYVYGGFKRQCPEPDPLTAA